MKKKVKIIGTAGAVALAAALVPYHFKSDKETGNFELGGLLWNLRKTAGETEDTYTMELLPFISELEKKKEAAKEEAPAEAAVETPEADETSEEEPFTDEVSNEVVVEVEGEPEEEPFAEDDKDVAVEVVSDEDNSEEDND